MDGGSPVQTGSRDFNRKLKKSFFESSLEIFTACFPLGYTPGLSALLCVCARAWSDQLIKDWR